MNAKTLHHCVPRHNMPKQEFNRTWWFVSGHVRCIVDVWWLHVITVWWMIKFCVDVGETPAPLFDARAGRNEMVWRWVLMFQGCRPTWDGQIWIILALVGYSKEWLAVGTSLLITAKLILKSSARVDADTCPSLKYASQQRSCTKPVVGPMSRRKSMLHTYDCWLGNFSPLSEVQQVETPERPCAYWASYESWNLPAVL